MERKTNLTTMNLMDPRKHSAISAIIQTVLVSSDQNAPSIPLNNAADPALRMPVIGLGTGGYSAAKSIYAHPEHWNASEGFMNTIQWFKAGGVRWDTALAYQSQPGVAQGLLNVTNNWTTTARSEVFITSKVGMGAYTMGYNDTIKEVEDTLELFGTEYIDLILIHWPSNNSTSTYSSSDPYCNASPSNKQYSPSLCRQSTWKALEFVFKAGFSIKSKHIF